MARLTPHNEAFFERQIRNAGYDPQEVDTRSEWDSSLTYRENKAHLAGKYGIGLPQYSEPRRAKKIKARKTTMTKKKKTKRKKLSAYNRHVQREMRAGKSMKAAARSWSGKSTRKKARTKSKTRVKRAQTTTRKRQVKTMPKKKKTTKKKTGTRSKTGIIGKAALLAGGAILGTGVMDYAVTGKLPTIATLTDRAQGVIGKIGNKEILYPLLIGGIVLQKYKLPVVSRTQAGMMGLGMVGAASYAAATTPGSPGTPVGTVRTVPQYRNQRTPSLQIINRRR